MGRVTSPKLKRPKPITIPKDMLPISTILNSDGDLVLTVTDGNGTYKLTTSDLVDTDKMFYSRQPYINEHKPLEKLFTIPGDKVTAIDFTTMDIIKEPVHALPKFMIGEKYALKGVSCDGFTMKEKVYELIGILDSYGGVNVESVIVKQVSGETGTIFTLSKNDCDQIGIEYQQGLQLFPKTLPWVRVIEKVEFNPHNLATTPTSEMDGTIRYILLELDGFKDYSDGYVVTPSGKLIREEQFERSVRVVSKEPIVYGNGVVYPDGEKLPITLSMPQTKVFNHGNFISSEDKVYILITLRKFEITPNGAVADNSFGVEPVYFDNLDPSEFFTIMWDELGAMTIEEFEAEKERARKEKEEAIKREEERLKKEAFAKKKAEEEEKMRAEEAISKMKNLRIRKPTFPSIPVFNTDIEALAGLDLYIDSLDSYFKDLDKQFSKMNFDLENVSSLLRRGSRGFSKSRVAYDYDDFDRLGLL
jgi:hypothetical protein